MEIDFAWMDTEELKYQLGIYKQLIYTYPESAVIEGVIERLNAEIKRRD